DLGWRYIKMTTDTTSEENRERFNFFISQIEPHIAPLTNKLNQKVIDNPYLEEVSKTSGYAVMIRSIKMALKIFKEENIPLNIEIQQLSQQYGAIHGDMTDRKSTRLNSSHVKRSYAVYCLKKKKNTYKTKVRRYCT